MEIVDLTPRAIIILNSRRESEKKADTIRKALTETGITLEQLRELVKEHGLYKEYGANINSMLQKERHPGKKQIYKYNQSGAADEVLERKHAAKMEKKRREHDAATTWMEHITPLHQQKQALERRIAERQAELDKAREEYRNFLATLEQLTKEA